MSNLTPEDLIRQCEANSKLVIEAPQPVADEELEILIEGARLANMYFYLSGQEKPKYLRTLGEKLRPGGALTACEKSTLQGLASMLSDRTRRVALIKAAKKATQSPEEAEKERYDEAFSAGLLRRQKLLDRIAECEKQLLSSFRQAACKSLDEPMGSYDESVAECAMTYLIALGQDESEDVSREWASQLLHLGGGPGRLRRFKLDGHPLFLIGDENRTVILRPKGREYALSCRRNDEHVDGTIIYRTSESLNNAIYWVRRKLSLPNVLVSRVGLMPDVRSATSTPREEVVDLATRLYAVGVNISSISRNQIELCRYQFAGDSFLRFEYDKHPEIWVTLQGLFGGDNFEWRHDDPDLLRELAPTLALLANISDT